MTTRSDSSTRAPYARRALISALGSALALASACSAPADDADDAAPSVLRQESDVPPLTAVATDITATTDLFKGEGCDAIYEFRAQGPSGPGTPQEILPGGEYHPQIMFDPPWGKERVQVIGWKPLTDNKKVIHHWIVWQGAKGQPSQNMMGWAPGSTGRPYPSDVGVEMTNEPGGLRLDLHYFNLTGTQTEYDRSGVVMCIVKGEHLRPKSGAVHGGFSTFSPLMVPANSRGYSLDGSCVVQAKEPITVVSTSPHAHTRAVRMRLSITKAGETEEKVLHEGAFSFYEQVTWPFEEPLIMNNGDTIKWRCTYDNDSNRNIGYGESTTDEMCIHWVAYYPKGQFTCGPTRIAAPVTPVTPATTATP